MENSIEMDDLGVPPFQETSICSLGQDSLRYFRCAPPAPGSSGHVFRSYIKDGYMFWKSNHSGEIWGLPERGLYPKMDGWFILDNG